jgi:hypothetical protein
MALSSRIVRTKSRSAFAHNALMSLGENMTHLSTDRRVPVKPSTTARPEAPAFKPVALPALAAAMQAARFQPQLPKVQELPAILRKEAVLG